jgi:hypothetical protein
LNRLDDDLVLRPLLSGRLVVPLIEPKSPLDANLAALLAILLNDVRQRATFAPIERVAINEHRLVFPLPCLRVLPAVVHRETKGRNFPTVAKRPDFGVTGQVADQNHFVEVRHVRRSWWVTGKSPN